MPAAAFDDLQDDLGSDATDDPHLPLLQRTEELTEFIHGITSFAGDAGDVRVDRTRSGENTLRSTRRSRLGDTLFVGWISRDEKLPLSILSRPAEEATETARKQFAARVCQRCNATVCGDKALTDCAYDTQLSERFWSCHFLRVARAGDLGEVEAVIDATTAGCLCPIIVVDGRQREDGTDESEFTVRDIASLRDDHHIHDCHQCGDPVQFILGELPQVIDSLHDEHVPLRATVTIRWSQKANPVWVKADNGDASYHVSLLQAVSPTPAGPQ